MKDEKRLPASGVSRRALLRNAALIGGATALGTTAMAPRAHAAGIQKAVVHYQDTPRGDERCSNCLQFIPPSSCKVVEGKISPHGWCSIWIKKH